MSPKIDQHAARISVNRAKQRAQRIVKSDDKNARAKRLQILRHETHPEFLARTNHENGHEQNDKVAFEPEKLRKPVRGAHALLVWRLHFA